MSGDTRGLTDDERRRMTQILDNHRKHTNEHGGAQDGAPPMTDDDCAYVREQAALGRRQSEIARDERVRHSYESLDKHIRGDCAHADEDARDAPERLALQLRALEREHGRVSRRMVRRRDDLPSEREYIRRLSDDETWTGALVAAGVELTRNQEQRREQASGGCQEERTAAEPPATGTPLRELL